MTTHLSDCCNSPMKSVCSDEGTCYYECTDCHQPADECETKQPSGNEPKKCECNCHDWETPYAPLHCIFGRCQTCGGESMQKPKATESQTKVLAFFRAEITRAREEAIGDCIKALQDYHSDSSIFAHQDIEDCIEKLESLKKKSE